MKKIFLTQVLFVFISTTCISQELTSKERAEAIAKNDFSKTKHKKKEKYGVVKEMNRVIESTPVINNDLSFYEGNYVYPDMDYKIEIRKDAQNKMMATLNVGDSPAVILKDVNIKDAFFQAVTKNANGAMEFWEGVFINKNDDGNVEFGLGIKLANPIRLTEGLSITKIFLKKVSS
jgi:hypothetical protein